MKCHIQLNQGWMRNFQNNIHDQNGKQVYCLSLFDLEITSRKINNLGQLQDYYVKDIENFYDIEYESRFGNITNKIIQGINKTTEYFKISEEEIEFIRKFISINISRSPLINIEANKKSAILNNIPNPPGLLSLAVHSENLKYFENYKIRFIYNSSSIGFVLPSYCQYRIFSNSQLNETIAVIPISDKIAIIFDKNDCDEFSVQNISDENEINDIYNYFALIVEIHTNYQYLIARTEKPLLELKNKIMSRIY